MLTTFIFVFSSVIMICVRVCHVSFACKPVPASHLSVFILVPADRHQLSNSPTKGLTLKYPFDLPMKWGNSRSLSLSLLSFLKSMEPHAFIPLIFKAIAAAPLRCHSLSVFVCSRYPVQASLTVLMCIYV